jgi:hypothetical protein
VSLVGIGAIEQIGGSLTPRVDINPHTKGKHGGLGIGNGCDGGIGLVQPQRGGESAGITKIIGVYEINQQENDNS